MSGYRCYYELSADKSMAYILDVNNNDVRSEGMSYGMMIAVQMDLQPQFDKLWKFAKTKMQYGDSPYPAWKNYFRWQGTSTGSDYNFGSATPAPDGDEYIAAALYLADQRWGSSGSFDYKNDADAISVSMLHNTPSDNRYPIIHATQNMIVFVPYAGSNDFTDPSYHLPAFYELFAMHGPEADAAKWRSLAATSRDFLVKSAHGTTGLHPDYATFQGAPTTPQGQPHDQFQYDAWRVVMNMAMDYTWFSSDARMQTQVEKYHAFFANYLGSNSVTKSLFKVDGSAASGSSSTALTATLAAGAMASNATNRATYVNNLWAVAQQEGQYRYYEQVLYLFGLLNVSGKYKYAW
jgi:oligosaccharide reducing-end xylanase